MYSKIKNEIKEIVQIVNECPPSLQEKCFEVLPSHLLMEVSPAVQKEAPSEVRKETVSDEPMNGIAKLEKVMNGETKNGEAKNVKTKTVEVAEPIPVEKKAVKANHDAGIQLTDFHTRVQNLLDVGSISVERINDLYVKENGAIFPIYSDLATDQPNVSQICLALLSSFENSLFTGEFEFEVETVKNRCKKMKCLDSDNFSNNFKNVKQLFEGDHEYKNGDIVQLSVEAKKPVLEVLNKVK